MAKICIIVADFKEPWAEAIKNYAKEIASALAKNHEIFCLSPSDFDGEKKIAGIKTYFFKSPFYSTKFKRVFYPIGLIKLMLGARKIIKKEQPDVIIECLESPSVGFIGYFLKKRSGKNTGFIQIVNAEYYQFKKTPLKYFLLDDFPLLLFNNKFFFKQGLKKADQNIVITKSLFKKLKTEGIRNLIYAPYGIKINKIKKTKSKKFRIGYLGHLIYAKGAGLLLEAFNNLPKEMGAQLLLATTWGSEEKLIKKVKNPNIKNYGILKDVSEFYSKCDLFVLPLRKSFSTLAMPRVILEAQAHGVPVLASDLENIKENIVDGKTGFLFKANNAEDLKNKIITIYKNKEKLAGIIKNAREQLKKKYNPKKIVEVLEKLIS